MDKINDRGGFHDEPATDEDGFVVREDNGGDRFANLLQLQAAMEQLQIALDQRDEAGWQQATHRKNQAKVALGLCSPEGRRVPDFMLLPANGGGSPRRALAGCR